MSRIFGTVGNISEELKKKLNSSDETAFKVHSDNSFYLSCSGPEGTNSFRNQDGEGFAMIGLSLEFADGKFKIPDAVSLMKNLPNDSFRNSLDGNFCGVFWNNETIRLFSDQSGIFDMYYFQNEGITYFSNDLTFLSSFMEKCELNTKTFSTRWLSVNQFSTDCILKNIHRLCKGETLTIEKNGSITLTARKIEDSKNTNLKTTDELLSNLFTVLMSGGHHISLSLSGGIDSRVLLAILTSLSTKDFSTHTFGPIEDQDSRTAREMTTALGIAHHQFFDPEDTVDEAISLIKEYVRSTLCISPASASFRLKYYPKLYEKRNIVVDGGFGEIGRRQYLNRLLFKKKSAIINADVDGIYEFSKLHRADIFNDDVNFKMVADAKSQIQKLIDELPGPKQVGPENWADIFSYHTRLPNFFGIEQIRMENYVSTLMPFGLKNIYQSIMNTDFRLRKNGNAFKKIVSQKNKRLTEFPLAKDNATYPFNSGFLTSRLRIKYQKLRSKATQPDDYEYLRKVKDFVLGLLYTKEAKNFELYNYNRISSNVQSFYEGNNEHAKFTDWWLTFEVMRRFIYKETF